MDKVLAIETATEACSVAWSDGEAVHQLNQIAPRQHSQILFGMLQDILPSGALNDHGVEAIAYGCGPGSFTGLRIAASAVQGLCYTSGLPAIPVSTLAAQAQTAVRLGKVRDDQLIFSALDARINEIYCGWFRVEDGLVQAVTQAQACPPQSAVCPDGVRDAAGIGSGCQFHAAMSPALRAALVTVDSDLLPEARDLIPLAAQQFARGETQTASQVQPVYVRDEINWKKIPQQGKQA